ncbi:hypothetical protein H5410_019720 [Solanum commersonii]|uniref:Uncharacterized protein n=1 Tax=Solanum commersonii TaxID=4109 RepID=A0A9J5Z951_SOLCO|nr:hypothetical protein H5410_019720 [Solanum commersonii]
MEEFYIFRAMVRDEGSNCLTYVQEADRINVQAKYEEMRYSLIICIPLFVGKEKVVLRVEGYVLLMEDQATQDVQAAPEHEPTNTEIVPYMTPQTPQISRDPSISSHENVFGSYRPQHFENAPNFTSSHVEGNELNDSNDEVNGDEMEDASQGGEPSVKKKRIIFPKLCGTRSHHFNEHGQKKQTKGNKVSVVTKKKNKG